jgi:hypothetical protein
MGSVPPLAASDCEYASPTVPPGRLPEMPIVGHDIAGERDRARAPSTLVTSSDALFGPTLVGWKPTATVAWLPGPMLVVLGAPTKNSDALAPEIANGGDSVTVEDALIVRVAPTSDPTGWVPKKIVD